MSDFLVRKALLFFALVVQKNLEPWILLFKWCLYYVQKFCVILCWLKQWTKTKTKKNAIVIFLCQLPRSVGLPLYCFNVDAVRERRKKLGKSWLLLIVSSNDWSFCFCVLSFLWFYFLLYFFPLSPPRSQPRQNKTKTQNKRRKKKDRDRNKDDWVMSGSLIKIRCYLFSFLSIFFSVKLYLL